MYVDNQSVRDAWAAWLQTFPWDHFLTVTLREPLPARRAESVVNAVGKHIVALTNPDMVFLASEPHLSGLTHLHGLYRANQGPWRWASADPELPLKLHASGLWQHLFETYGRSQVARIRTPEAVTGYCSKYVTKWEGIYGLYP